jgi:CheY-like chemotaxis protein
MQTPIALLVDDDDEFRSLFADVLREEGYEVFEAANGVEALSRLAVVTPDVIVVDLVMPVMNGWALHATLRKRPELHSIPVVFLSALGSMAPPGGAMVVTKPLDLPRLTTLLDALRPQGLSGNIPIATRSGQDQSN